ncbi:HNH endonuclease [Sphingorhabdus sp.]|jgi:putative restriction endonuclease|uniref:HNH endonuclease n=1 Tax=Sphingorhabdus sp. TaxID=1902408 RepID=UPI0037C68EB0
MRYWWVNQNQTYKHETEGGFLWSPKRNRNGRSNRFYDNMTEVRAGDLVLSFCDTQIKAIGIAQGSAQSAVKPEFGNVGKQWDDDGWYVPVEFEEVSNPIRPKDFIDELRPYLAAKYAPLQPNGNGNQGVYLAEVSEAFAKTILTRMGVTLDPTLISDEAIAADTAEEQAQTAIQGRTDIGATQKAQMILARRGQGIFRANVRLNEKACRVTGVTDPRFLIASHIKPWRLSDDREKLDGCNGLLLSPHIDRLFDKGYISFDDDGAILKSTKLPKEVWKHWELTAKDNVGTFNDMQRAYLRFHRAEVFS